MTKGLRRSVGRLGRGSFVSFGVWGAAAVMLFFSGLHALAGGGPLRPAGRAVSDAHRSFLLEDGGQAAFQRGLVALRENRLDAALEELTAAERERPKDGLIRNFRGIVLAQMGRATEAREEYRGAIWDDPKLEAAYRNLGFLEWSGHELDAAQRELETALKLAPDDGSARYYLGRVDLDAGRYWKAFPELERSGMPLPEDADVQLLAAGGYIRVGRQKEGSELLHRLVSRTLSGAQTAQLASLLLAAHEGKTSVELLERWGRDHPEDAKTWAGADVRVAYLLAGEYEPAVKATQVPCFDRGSPPPLPGPAALRAGDVCSVLGIADARLGRGDRSIEAFRRAIELAPGKEELWLNLTRQQMELSRLADAIAAAEAAVGAYPQSYALQLRLGAAYLAVDRYTEAEAVFRRIGGAGDPMSTSVIGLAQVLLRSGRPLEAVRELRAERRRLGPNFLLCYFEGLAYNRAAEPAEAATAYREALGFNPESAEAHAELGKTELKQAHLDASIAELQRALALDPANVQARRLLQQASHRAGKIAPTVTEPAPSAAPVSDLVGDFIVPQWEKPEN